MENKTYIVDASVLIEAANAYYSFESVPGFWEWLTEQGVNESIRSASMVGEEVEYPPQLVEWLEERETEGFLIDVSEPEIQAEYQKMAAWVIEQNFGPEHVAKFLDGADLWIIAAAKVTGATVVTQETLAGAGTKKIKIPNVCAVFEVDCINTFTMIGEKQARFTN